jgi:hypothetical protein
MSEQSAHTRLHVGSFIEIQRLESDLAQVNIPCLIKNNHESARLAGFGAMQSHVELYIFEKDLETASQILKNLLDEIN